MKELSIEEKAKRYDEAIKKAKYYYGEGKTLEYASDITSYIFPELKESKDEKWVPKEIIKYLKEKGDFRSCWIAWLEKQGVHAKFINGIQVGDKVTRNEDGVLVNLSQLNRVAKKQCEHKPADKVEPKFIKVEKDKWYVCISKYCNCIEGRNYKATSDGRIIDDYGTEYDMHSDAYKWFRPWTIQDAKDGDVLVSESTCGLGTWYCIFKSLDGDESITVYCYLAMDGRFETKKELCFDKDPYNTNPATKEQRDTLIKAMADAGYTFDFEKKELKEIDTAEWSEECCINQLIVFCENCMVQDSNAKKCASFLKSLKERYTWKPSEEQMNTLEYYMHTLICNEHKEVLFGLYADLNKLREK